MSNILRETIALIIAKVDEPSFKEVNSRMFRMRTAIGGAIAGLVTSQFLKFGEEAARLADAEKIMNATGMSIETLRKQTRGLYSDMSLVVNYNKAQQFGIGKYFSDLANIADAAGKKFGVAQEKALEDLMIGVSQGRNARLDNLGIVVDWHKEFDKAAADMGIKRKDLPKANQAEIAMLAVKRIGANMIQEAASSGAVASDVYDQLQVRLDQVKVALGRLFNAFATDLLPITMKFFQYLEQTISHPGFIHFFTDLGTIVGWVARILFTATSVVVNFVSILGNIPGSAYLITLALVAFAIPALTAFTFAMMDSIAASKLWIAIGSRFAQVTSMFGVGRVAVIGFATATLQSAAALLGVALAMDEVAAAMDPEKLGFFEEWGGRWDKFRERMQKSNMNEWLQLPLDAFSRFAEFVERIGTGIANIVEGLVHLTTGGLLDDFMEKITFNRNQGGEFFKDFGAYVLGLGTSHHDMNTGDIDRQFEDVRRLHMGSTKLRAIGSLSLPNDAYHRPSFLSQGMNLTIAPQFSIDVDASGQPIAPAVLRSTIFGAAKDLHDGLLQDTHDNLTKGHNGFGF